MKKRPWYQLLATSVAWALAGYLALGAALDATGNAIALVTPVVTYSGTALVTGSWIAAWLYLRRRPLPWVGHGNAEIRIRRLGWQSNLFLGGILVLLWVPRVFGPAGDVAASNPTNQNQAAPVAPPSPQTPGRVTILVADFAGPDPSKFGVTETIIEQLREATADFPTIVIESAGRTVTAQEGAEVARRLGQEHQAVIVVWGWYAVNSRRVLLNTHCEILESPKTLKLLKGRQTLDLETASFESFGVQSQLSEQMSYLVLLTLGVARLEAEDYETAISMFSEAERSATPPTDLVPPEDLRMFRGSAYLRSSERDPGRLRQAVDDYSTAIKLNPTRGEAYLDRGVALELGGRFAESVDDFTKAIELGPERILYAAFANRAIARAEAGDRQSALEDARHLVAAWPDQPQSHNTLGSVLLPDIDNRPDGPHIASVDDLNAASSAFSQATRIDPDYAPGYANQAIVSFMENNRAEAIRLASRAIELDPYDAAARNLRGSLYLDSQQNRPDLAIEDFSAIIERFPSGAYAYYSRGLAYLLARSREQARADWVKAIELSANDPDTRALAENALKQFDK